MSLGNVEVLSWYGHNHHFFLCVCDNLNVPAIPKLINSYDEHICSFLRYLKMPQISNLT